MFTDAVKDDLPDIVRLIVKQALDGDRDSQRLLFNRFAPTGPLGALLEPTTDDQPFDATKASVDILNEMIAGNISPEECGRVLQSIAYYETIVLAKSDREKLDMILEGKKI